MTSFQLVQSPEQIAEVARLAREIWLEHYVPIIGEKQVDYMLDNFQSERAIAAQLGQAYEYYLVSHAGRSAGYVAVVPDRHEPLLMLSKLYVRSAERGLGLGKQALGFVEGLCVQRDIRKLWLTVNKHNAQSIGWYLGMGFQNVGPVVQDIGGGYVMDDFRMEKLVSSK